jgi:glycosyltransferase involved in cell wall biosynthesis
MAESMSYPPVVSVVLPVWNGAPFLASAIESMLDQSFTSMELIVVDDGSDDGSAEIAGRYAERDSRVKVILQEHIGLSQALNAGIAVATGNYVARMDADDVSHPDRLARQVAFLEANPGHVAVGCAIEAMDESGRDIGTVYFAEAHEHIVSALLRGTSPIAHPTVVMRRAALLAAGGYDASLYPSDDFALWIALSEHGRLANLRVPLHKYRRHDHAVSIRLYPEQLTMTARIVSRARKTRGLAPLRSRLVSPRKPRARYHFDCARVALVSGKRSAAARHAGSGVLNDPLWIGPYVAFLACLFPLTTVRAVVAMRARLRFLQAKWRPSAPGA